MRKLRGTGQAYIAVVFVGEKPGLDEDRLDKCFVETAPAGEILHKAFLGYIAARVHRDVDFYGANAVRCKPTVGASVTETQASKCCDLYLREDLEALSRSYTRVIVVATGGPACKAIFGVSVGLALRRQGKSLTDRFPVHPGTELAGFATYNPGLLLPFRDPSMSEAIPDHLSMVVDFINHGVIPMEVKVRRHYPADKRPRGPVSGTIFSLDIETYGCVEGCPEQTTFHPQRSVVVDRCPVSQLVQTVAITYRTGKSRHSCLYILPDEWGRLVSMLEAIVDGGGHILGQNLCFDLKYLRFARRSVRRIIDRQRMLKSGSLLLELSVANFLDNDMRPERSLKSLSPLLRVWDYSDETDLSSGFRYTDNRDPEENFYNVVDTVATLESWERLRDRTARRWGSSTEKFSEGCLRWFSDVLWTCLEMDESGICMDRERLGRLDAKLERRLERLDGWARRRWDLKLRGTGSEAPLRSLMVDAVNEAGLGDDSRVVVTRVKGISISKENIHLVLDRLPVGSHLRTVFRFREASQSANKIRTHYTKVLLSDQSRGLIGNMAWPTWFPCPSRSDDDSGALGGTKQGRLTCHKPGDQTFPAVIRDCYMSRYKPGFIMTADSSQIERRLMALFSGDPVMMREYIDDLDAHGLTGLIFVGALYSQMKSRNLNTLYGAPKSEVCDLLTYMDGRQLTRATAMKVRSKYRWFEVWRQLGKTANFLMGFLGGAETLQSTARRDNRIELPLGFCREVVQGTARRYAVFTGWQHDLIEETVKKKRIEGPITGESRTFKGPLNWVRLTYPTNIVNFYPQWGAASIIKAAQREITDTLMERGLLSRPFTNCYDAVKIDGPLAELDEVRAIVDNHMDNPAFYRGLCDRLGRELPLAHEVEVKTFKGK